MTTEEIKGSLRTKNSKDMTKIVKILDVGDSFELTRVLKEVTKCTGSTAINTVRTLKEPV